MSALTFEEDEQVNPWLEVTRMVLERSNLLERPVPYQVWYGIFRGESKTKRSLESSMREYYREWKGNYRLVVPFKDVSPLPSAQQFVETQIRFAEENNFIRKIGRRYILNEI